MARTISTPLVGPFVLSLTDPLGSDDPLTITSTGAITSAVGDGIDGNAATAWIILNNGTVTGDANGIVLAGTGGVLNTGLISAEILDGISIGAFGVVVNTGTIYAGMAPFPEVSIGVAIGANGRVLNRGTIMGVDGGVTIADAGDVLNQGLISGDMLGGAVNIGGVGRVINTGTILGGDAWGVVIDGGGTVTNGATALITGHASGVMISGGTGVVTNNGSILGALDGGVELFGGGTVTNSGSIFGTFGVLIRDGGTVTNTGSINGQVGVSVMGGGTVTNDGSINGGVAVDFGTVTNDGTISSSGSPLDPVDSVTFGPGSGPDRLIVSPGAVFDGPAVSSNRDNSTIELTQGAGTISGIGSGQFIGFNKLVVDGGADWILSGPNVIETVQDDGILEVAGSLVTTFVAPSSTGTFLLAGGSSLGVESALGIASKIRFTAGSDLVVDNFGLFGVNVGMSNYAGPLLEKFGGATVDLKDFSLAGLSSSFSAGLLQLTNSAAQLATLKFQTASLGAGTFHFATDGSGGVLITHT
jgi:hypothetical protein